MKKQKNILLIIFFIIIIFLFSVADVFALKEIEFGNIGTVYTNTSIKWIIFDKDEEGNFYAISKYSYGSSTFQPGQNYDDNISRRIKDLWFDYGEEERYTYKFDSAIYYRNKIVGKSETCNNSNWYVGNGYYINSECELVPITTDIKLALRYILIIKPKAEKLFIENYYIANGRKISFDTLQVLDIHDYYADYDGKSLYRIPETSFQLEAKLLPEDLKQEFGWYKDNDLYSYVEVNNGQVVYNDSWGYNAVGGIIVRQDFWSDLYDDVYLMVGPYAEELKIMKFWYDYDLAHNLEEDIAGKIETNSDGKLKVYCLPSPQNAPNHCFWELSDSNVAEFPDSSYYSSRNNEIVFKNPGTVTLTATTADGSNISASTDIIYNPYVSIFHESSEGEDYTGRTIPTPESSAKLWLYADVSLKQHSPSFQWSSSDENIATVTAWEYSGGDQMRRAYVSFKQNGTVIITATDTKSGLSGYVVFGEVLPTESVKIYNLSGEDYTGKHVKISNKTIQLTAKALPINALQSFTWSSSDPNIAEVHSGQVIFKKGGTVTITATATDGSKKSANVTLTYKPKAKYVQIFDPDDNNVTNKTLKITDKKFRLKAKAFPEDASQEFIWSSSDPSIATVNSNGLVTFNKEGMVKITATTTDESGKSAWVNLKYAYPSSLMIITEDKIKVDNFHYVYGSVIANAGGNIYNDKVYYILYSSENESNFGWATIELPDGFSFDFNHIEKKYDIFVDKGKTTAVPIYPLFLYKSKKNTTLDFKITASSGVFEDLLEMDVTEYSDQGKVRCRSLQQSYAINEKVNIDPIEDILNTPVFEYNDRLSWMGNTLSQSAYSIQFTEYSLRNLGYLDVESYGYDNANQADDSVATAIGLRSIIDENNKVTHQLAIVVRGTYDIEWVGNFLIYHSSSAERVHSNFMSNANLLSARVLDYCEEKNIDISTAKLFVTGHSRAGAIVDLYTYNYLNSKAYEATAYTFAAPNSTKDPKIVSNIFNIINANDLVPYVPAGKEWGKLGVNIVFNEITSTNINYVIPIALILGHDAAYQWLSDPDNAKFAAWVELQFPADEGPIADNHCAEMYLGHPVFTTDSTIPWEAAPNEYLFLSGVKLLKHSIMSYLLQIKHIAGEISQGVVDFIVGCPVNLEILDQSGNTVAHFINHELISINDSIGLGFSDGEEDIVVLFDNQNYDVKITATDNGSMYVQMTKFDQNMNEISTKLQENIPLFKDVVYKVNYDPSESLPEVLMDEILNEENVFYFPRKLQNISQRSFYMTSADVIFIPSNIRKIESQAFAACTNLKKIYFESGNNIEIAEDFLAGSNSDVEIIAPEGSMVALNKDKYK